MDGTHAITMGDRGRLVVPAGVRERAGLSEGTPLILLETPMGIVLLTREQLRARARSELAGLDLVAELLGELHPPHHLVPRHPLLCHVESEPHVRLLVRRRHSLVDSHA